jgi:DNA-binding winged helix-turn-helix (wHTH) protein
VAISLLGPLHVDGGAELSPRDRVVVSALAVQAGRVLTADQLADALWGEDVPPSGPKILQGCIVRLRRVLGKNAIETTTAGYRLALTDEEIDVRQFERLLGRGQKLAESGEHERAAAAFGQALQLWRGPAFPDVNDWAPGQSETSRLDELRRQAQDSLRETDKPPNWSARSTAMTDQLEELFMAGHSPELIANFLNRLSDIVMSGPAASVVPSPSRQNGCTSRFRCLRERCCGLSCCVW